MPLNPAETVPALWIVLPNFTWWAPSGSTTVNVILQEQGPLAALMTEVLALSPAVKTTELPDVELRVPPPETDQVYDAAGDAVSLTFSPTPILVRCLLVRAVETVSDVIVQGVGQGGGPASTGVAALGVDASWAPGFGAPASGVPPLGLPGLLQPQPLTA